MIVWQDDTYEIRHPALCKCSFCKIERVVETCVKRSCRWWYRPDINFYKPNSYSEDWIKY